MNGQFGIHLNKQNKCVSGKLATEHVLFLKSTLKSLKTVEGSSCLCLCTKYRNSHFTVPQNSIVLIGITLDGN